jgi:hypothetical protein
MCIRDSASRAGEEIGMRDAPHLDGVFERLGDRVLPNHVVKRQRPVFSCQNGVSHSQLIVD